MKIRQGLAVATLIVVSPFTAAQCSTVQQEVRAFIAEYDQTVADGNIAFLERVIQNDYLP